MLSVKIIFSHVVLGTPVLITKEKPRKNQGTTKELRKNAKSQNVRFIKIAASFPPFVPSLIPPTDDREKTERTPTEYFMTKKALFLRLNPKKFYLIPEKVVSIPKKVDSVSKIVDSSVSK